MKVWNLAHQNQYVWYENGEYHFQSYDTEVAIYLVTYKVLELDRYNWDYSQTTLKHLYLFIDMYCQETNWYPMFKKAKCKKTLIQALIEKGIIETYA